MVFFIYKDGHIGTVQWWAWLRLRLAPLFLKTPKKYILCANALKEHIDSANFRAFI
jgi:hypothetical protein